MSKMKFLDPKEAEKFKNKSGKCFVGHPVYENIPSATLDLGVSVKLRLKWFLFLSQCLYSTHQGV